MNFSIDSIINMKKIADMYKELSKKDVSVFEVECFQQLSASLVQPLNELLSLSEVFFMVNSLLELPSSQKKFLLLMFLKNAHVESVTLQDFTEISSLNCRESLTFFKAIQIIEAKGIEKKWQVFKLSDKGLLVTYIFLNLYSSSKRQDDALDSLITESLKKISLSQQENNIKELKLNE